MIKQGAKSFDVFTRKKGSWRYHATLNCTNAEEAKQKVCQEQELMPSCVSVYLKR